MGKRRLWQVVVVHDFAQVAAVEAGGMLAAPGTGTRCSTLRTVNELNARARSDRIAAGAVSEAGVTLAGGSIARGRGPGDHPPERPAPDHRETGVRTGDQWTVTAS